MKVEIISIGTALLASDILDTNAAYITRAMQELNVELDYKVTVGDNLAHITDVFRIALERSDLVFSTGGLDFAYQASAAATQLPLDPRTGFVAHSIPLADDANPKAGFILDKLPGMLICLPANRREMAYLLETKVFLYLRQRIHFSSEWLILRTVGVMESTLRQQLVGIPLAANQRISFDSYAGQTNIRLRVQSDSAEERQQQLAWLRRTVLKLLGDQVFGAGEARLETIIVRMLTQGHYRLAVVECRTGHLLSQLLANQPAEDGTVTLLAADDPEEISSHLALGTAVAPERLVGWQRQVAEALLRQTAVHLALFLHNETTPGGVQLSVILASHLGVSVTQRSFSGHPRHIQQWACNLGLAHLHRWLLAHA